MELFDLEFGLKAVAAGGNVLNCQETTCVQAGLNVLKMQQKYAQVFFWGKIFGSGVGGEAAKGPQDYYIAYAIGDAGFEFPSKIFHYATDDFKFQPLPLLTEETADKIIDLGIDGPFSGDPKKIIEPVVEGDENAADENAGDENADNAPKKPVKLTEADRLAQVVQEIDFDTAVVPKGAYALNESHMVVPSGDFKGIGITEATSIAKYVHFRPPTSVASLRALARTDMEFFADFLDPLEGDLPKGCWAIRQDTTVALITLRSLLWPGYIAFHVPTTPKHGGLYFGYGQKNRDLPFIL
jgi:radial spoke head protein 9